MSILMRNSLEILASNQELVKNSPDFSDGRASIIKAISTKSGLDNREFVRSGHVPLHPLPLMRFFISVTHI